MTIFSVMNTKAIKKCIQTDQMDKEINTKLRKKVKILIITLYRRFIYSSLNLEIIIFSLLLLL